MTNKRPRFFQKVKEIQVSKDSSHTEQSSYWDAAEQRGYKEGRLVEHPQANPDVLPETEIAAPSTPQLLMGEAIEHLQGRQRECYILTMREGKSLSEAGEILGISKDSARTHKDRAIKFITKYCEEAIKGGRV